MQAIARNVSTPAVHRFVHAGIEMGAALMPDSPCGNQQFDPLRSLGARAMTPQPASMEMLAASMASEADGHRTWACNKTPRVQGI